MELVRGHWLVHRALGLRGQSPEALRTKIRTQTPASPRVRPRVRSCVQKRAVSARERDRVRQEVLRRSSQGKKGLGAIYAIRRSGKGPRASPGGTEALCLALKYY